MKKKGRKSKNQKSENVNQWDALMIVKQNQESITVEKKPKKRICKVKRLEKGGGARGTGRGAADAQLSTRCCCCRV